MYYVKCIRLFNVSQTSNLIAKSIKGSNPMKTLLTVLAVALTLTLAGQAIQSNNVNESRADCLSKEDVTWHTNRSKSGIPRGCTNADLQSNLDDDNSQWGVNR